MGGSGKEGRRLERRRKRKKLCTGGGKLAVPPPPAPSPPAHVHLSSLAGISLQEPRAAALKWPGRCRDNWPYTAAGFGAETPQAGERVFSLCLLSGPASLPSPLTGWGRGQASPLPPSSPLPKGKSTPSTSCQCPSAMSGQRQQARSFQLGWGKDWNKGCAFIVPNSKRRWAVGIGEKKKERRGRAEMAPQGFCGVAGHRWLPSDF